MITVTGAILSVLMILLCTAVLLIGAWRTKIRFLARIAMMMEGFAAGYGIYVFLYYNSNTFKLDMVIIYLLIGSIVHIFATLHRQYDKKIKNS